MKRCAAGWCVVWLAMLVGMTGCSTPPDQLAVAGVEAVGGKAKIDQEGQVVEVDLSHTKANDALLADRVRSADRPRVHAGASLEEDLARIWRESADLYRQAADLVYRLVPGRGIDESVADLLVLALSQRPPSGVL